MNWTFSNWIASLQGFSADMVTPNIALELVSSEFQKIHINIDLNILILLQIFVEICRCSLKHQLTACCLDTNRIYIKSKISHFPSKFLSHPWTHSKMRKSNVMVGQQLAIGLHLTFTNFANEKILVKVFLKNLMKYLL